MRVKKAFTLAETLIVLAIIGVVAVLTIPNISKSTSEKETIAKLKKTYNVVETAFQSVVSKYGSLSDLFNHSTSADNSLNLMDAMKKYVDNVASYGTSPKGFTIDIPMVQRVVLKDGSTLGIRIDAAGTTAVTSDDPTNGVWGFVVVDIDGEAKGSGLEGEDTFFFHITDKGLIPYGMPTDNLSLFSGCFTNGGHSRACTAWAVLNGNMDYLHVNPSGKCFDTNKTLNWDTQTSCR